MKSKWWGICIFLSLLLVLNILSTPAIAQSSVPDEASALQWFLEKILAPIVAALAGIILGHILSRKFLQRELKLKEKELSLKAKEFYLKTGIRPFDTERELKRAETPATFAREYEQMKRFIDDVDVTFSAEGTDYSTSSPLDEKIRDHVEKADQLWSSGKRSDRYRSAYSYALAAYANVRIRRWSDAGRLYHFAAHEFRELGEYELAGICYKWAGDLYQKNSKYIHARRAYRRARKAFSRVGDEDIIKKIQDLEDKVSRFIAEAPLEWWDQPGILRKRSPH